MCAPAGFEHAAFCSVVEYSAAATVVQTTTPAIAARATMRVVLSKSIVRPLLQWKGILSNIYQIHSSGEKSPAFRIRDSESTRRFVPRSTSYVNRGKCAIVRCLRLV